MGSTKSRSWLAIASVGLICAACEPKGIGLRPDPDPVQEARQMTRSGQAVEAVECFEDILRDDPEDLAAHRGLVEAAYFAGRLAEFERRYRSRASGGEGLGHYGLALCAVARGPGGMKAAIEHFQKAEELMPTEADVPYRIGLVYIMDADFERAAAALQRAIERDGQRPEPRVALAHCRLQLNESAKAMDILRPILNQSPGPDVVSKARAVAARIFDLERDIPPDAAPEIQKATTYLGQEGVQQALLLLSELAARYPELALVHFLKGLAHSRMDNRGEAIVALERAIQLRPDNPEALVALGDIYFRVGKWQMARKSYLQAVGLNPFYLEAHMRMAELCEARGDHEGALQAYEKVVLLEPDNVRHRHAYADALARTGRLEDAVAALEAILLYNPDELETLIRVARLYLALAEKRPARRVDYRQRGLDCVRQAQELSPDNQALRELLDSLEG
ncbi:MAG: tetratricopeptide repeat protein [Deltaproteobacteria bacterium]|nr:tetratricopeptide repeat protein [Deltaproteobacteria bacterium]